MYYVMNDNVYLVKGRRRSCIYDLSNNKPELFNEAHQ